MLRHASGIFPAALAAIIAGEVAHAAPPGADALSLYAALYARDAGLAFAPGPEPHAGEPASGRPAFTLLSTPAGAPRGSVAWLARSHASEPLAPTYDAPQTPRKEMGVSYSSEGRIDAYVAAREHSAAGEAAPSESADCCREAPGPATYAARRARGLDGDAGSSVLGRLKSRGLRLSLHDGWDIKAGARTREYVNPALKSRIAHVTLHRWWGDWRTGYALQVEKRGGWNVAPSQSLQLDYAFAPRTVMGVAYTAGHEIAFFGALGMLKTEVRSFTLQGEHTVRKDWSLKFEAGYYDHGELPAHRSIRVAFRKTL